MSQRRVVAHKMAFVGAGQQSVAIAADEFVNLFQADITIDSDTNITILIGATEIRSFNLKDTALPIQLFFYAFGKGIGTGEKGADLTVQLGGAGTVWLEYIVNVDN